MWHPDFKPSALKRLHCNTGGDDLSDLGGGSGSVLDSITQSTNSISGLIAENTALFSNVPAAAPAQQIYATSSAGTGVWLVVLAVLAVIAFIALGKR